MWSGDNVMNKKQNQIPENVVQTEAFMKENVGLGISTDLGVRKLNISNKEVHLYYVDGLTETGFIIEIIEQLVKKAEVECNSGQMFEFIENNLVHRSISRIETLDELVDKVLAGSIVLLVDGTPMGLVVNFRSFPDRKPKEPVSEKIVRGSRDGYVENIIINTALTRRRIRDERLRFEKMVVGERSKTDIAIGYIKGVANPKLLDMVRNKLRNIKIDGLTMADKTVEECIIKQGYNPYPLVRYTERADVASAHLLEGHIIIFIDTSPSAIILPTTIFHHMQHAEEFRQSPFVGTMLRWVEFLGILASFLLPFWLLFCLEPSLLPESLTFITPKKETGIPIFVQIFIIEMGIELLRLAAIHTPVPTTKALGLISAVLIGKVAINAGLFVPEVILYTAVATIGTYVISSLELGMAHKILRLVLLLAVAIFHVSGLLIGLTLMIIKLASIKTFNTPYLWPIIPFQPKALSHILIRRPLPGSWIRPSMIHPQDRYRQPK